MLGASNGDSGGEQGGGGGEGGGGGGEENDVQLRDVLSSEALRPIVRDSQVSSDLAPHLPPTNEPTEAVVTSPQFQQVRTLDCLILLYNHTVFKSISLSTILVYLFIARLCLCLVQHYLVGSWVH